MNKQLAFRILVLAIFILLIVPMLIQDGMFMDGLIYASVAHNLANGLGDFWALTFSETYLKNYSEQLPLFFGIQALFFKVFGSSLYVERIFLLTMACLTAFNIIKTWKLIYSNSIEKRRLEWLPVLLWILIPICFWSYVNNVQETLMAVFATASVYFAFKALILKRNVLLYLTVSGVFVFCCSFCKGFQGLFPIVTVAIYWIITREISVKQMIWYSFVLIAVPALIYIVLLLNESSFQAISENFNNRVLRTFNKPSSSTTDNRFYLMYRLFTEHIPSILVVILIYTISYFKHIKVNTKGQFKLAAVFFLIGIAGSLPLIVTSEQRGFYLVTSLPFFALCLSILAAPYLSPLTQTIKSTSRGFKALLFGSIGLLFTAIILSGLQFGKTKRDHNALHDVYLIGETIPKGSTLNITPKLRQDYSLVAYFVRYYNINLDLKQSSQNPYYLKKKDLADEAPSTYQKMNLDLKEYDLYEKVRK